MTHHSRHQTSLHLLSSLLSLTLSHTPARLRPMIANRPQPTLPKPILPQLTLPQPTQQKTPPIQPELLSPYTLPRGSAAPSHGENQVAQGRPSLSRAHFSRQSKMRHATKI
ncbi:hypothetical protein BKA65DRAFT_2165 [Rhexocercosporidium sp. MPI-PUGE-AT-0058]|nr:hypothetical protein BKA65DRAFT_2165 [Rhexocercosporidium sp. MPI-PUGE-AT-0058]